MPRSDEAVVVLVMRIAELPVPGHPESVQGRCFKCSEPVWIGPAMAKELERRPGSRLECLTCHEGFLATLDPDEERPEYDMLPSVRREAAEQMAKMAEEEG